MQPNLSYFVSIEAMNNNQQKYLSLTIVLSLMPLLLWGLNFLVSGGYLGSTIQQIYDGDKDASGIFWTDVEGLLQN